MPTVRECDPTNSGQCQNLELRGLQNNFLYSLIGKIWLISEPGYLLPISLKDKLIYIYIILSGYIYIKLIFCFFHKWTRYQMLQGQRENFVLGYERERKIKISLFLKRSNLFPLWDTTFWFPLREICTFSAREIIITKYKIPVVNYLAQDLNLTRTKRNKK